MISRMPAQPQPVLSFARRLRPLIAILAVGALASEIEAQIGDKLRGRALFVKHCAICHGTDAKGTGALAPTLPVQPANLTDCRIIAEDSIDVLQGIIRHGGTYVGLSEVMPAWGGTLTEAEIADVASYVKSLCTDPDWVPGELNFPPPLIAGTAFPDQEVRFSGRFSQNKEDVNLLVATVEYRLGGRTSVELRVPYSSVNRELDSTESGLGDVRPSVKHVIAFSPAHLALASAGLRVSLPSGSESRGLGTGEVVWQPNLRAGWDWNQLVTQGSVILSLPHESSSTSSLVQYALAVGRYFEPDPRLQITPMVQSNTLTRIAGAAAGDTMSSIIPQFRIQWLQWSAAVGVEVPVTGLRAFDVRELFDVNYEYVF